MTDQPECRPPAEFEDIKNHWLVFRGDTANPRVWQWNNFMKDEWIKGFDDGYSTQSLASDGWTYLAPCRPDDAVERVRLQALVDALDQENEPKHKQQADPRQLDMLSKE